MRRAALTALAALVVACACAAPASAARARFDTSVFSLIPFPGYPALGYVHPDGHVYEGTYENANAGQAPSRVFEFTGEGTLQRSWTVPGQELGGEQGVQVATSDAKGNLVLLDRRPGRALKLDRSTGAFSTYATFADLKPCASGTTGPNCSPTGNDAPATPNYAAWGPDGSLYVTDYSQAVVWRVPPGGGAATVWLADRRFDGGEFGTTGLALGADRRTLYIGQGSGAGLGGSLNVAAGGIYAASIGSNGAPTGLRQIWESAPGDLPDGFAIAKSGRFYVPLVGLPGQIAVLGADGREQERFPKTPGPGDNGSPIPFDSPSSARFLGTRLIVANQSALAGDATHQALLDVEAGEPGLPEFIPGRDDTAPVVSSVSIRPSRFAPVRRGGGLRAKRRGHAARGGKLRLRLSEAATVQVRVERRVGKRWRRVQTIEKRLAKGGKGFVRIRGRVKRGKRSVAFPRGRYRLSFVASDAAGNRSARRYPGFRIVR